MTDLYGTERGSASREAPGPLHLAAPLREVWSVSLALRGDALAPVFGAGGLLVGCHDAELLAMKATTREVIWRQPGSFPLLLHDGCVVTQSSHGLLSVDLRTGERRRVLPMASVLTCVVAEDVLIAATWNDEYGAFAITAIDWRTAQGLWSVPLGTRGFPRISRMSVREGALVYQLSGPLEESASTVARDTRTGEELWSRTRFGSVSHPLPLTSAGLIVSAERLHSIDVATGLDRWSGESVGGAPYVYQGRIYQHGCRGYGITDLLTGKRLFSANLIHHLPKSLQRTELLHVVLVSETHVFIGAKNAALFGFTRDAGEYVFNFHPPGSQSVTTDLAHIDGRVYHRSAPKRLSCLEPRP